MNWKPELDDLARREAFAREMGGVDKVKRQRDQGRLTVRERIDKLVDAEKLSTRSAPSPAAPNMMHAGELHQPDAGQLRVRPRQDRRPNRWWWSAMILRYAAVRPTRRSRPSR